MRFQSATLRKEGSFFIFCKKVFIPSISLCLCIAGCTGSKDKIRVSKKQDIIIDVPFEPYRTWMGWVDSANGKTGAFYFANLTTFRKILFFDYSGRQVDSIPIAVEPRWRDKLKGLVVYNRDTIATSSEYLNNHLYFFNHEGEVFRDISLPVKLHDTVYEAMGYGVIKVEEADKLIFQNNLITAPGIDDTTLTEKVQTARYYKASNAMPVALMYESLHSDNVTLKQLGTGLINRYTQEEHVSLLASASCASSRYYYYSTPNADSIYRLDINKDEGLNKAVPIQSRFSETKVLPFLLDTMPRDGLISFNNYVSYRCLKFDKYRHYIYLTFFYPAPQDASPADAGEHRKWSLLIFDEDLNRLAEIPFEKDTYDPNDLIIHPNGIFLRKTDGEHSHKAIFTLFTVLPNS